jgi:hypothetical protein
VPGYPVDGLWAQAVVGYGDANGDGYIQASEVRLSDSAMYAGHSAPTHRIGWQNNVSVLSGRLSLGANFTYEGGGTQYNGLISQQCIAGLCRAAVDPTSSLEQQVLPMAVSAWPYLERFSLFRFEELSLTVDAPARITRALRSQRASVSLMGRNLKLWTKYRGADPEVNTSSLGGDNVADAGGIPQPRSWTVRVNLGY